MTGARLQPADRRILSLALPALGTLAVEPLYVLVDTAIVGRLGTPQLGGLALAATVLSFVVIGSNFLTYGATERVARRIGAGDPAAAADVGVQALWLAALVGLPLAGLLALAARPLCIALGGSGEVLDHAELYLRISAAGIPFVVLTLAANGVLRGNSQYRVPLLILFVANLLNTVLELIFVLGLDYGMAGSAWSTVIGQVVGAAAFAVVVRRYLRPARSRRPSRAGVAPLVSAGRHLVLRVATMLAVLGGSTAIAARIDEPTLAAHQVVIGMFGLVALSLDALAIPAQTLVAEELGRDDRTTARHLARRAVVLSLWAAVVVALVVAGSARWLPQAFTSDAAVADRATVALVFLAASMLPASIAFAYDGVLIGAGDYRFLGLAALAYLAAIAPLGVVILAVPRLGIGGIWASLGAWMILRAIVNHRRADHVLMPAGTAS